MEENNIFQNAAQILYGKNKEKEEEEKNLRNSLLNELGDNLETKHILYSSTEDLKKMKEEKDIKNSNIPLNKLSMQTSATSPVSDLQQKAKLLGKIPVNNEPFKLYAETVEDLAKRNTEDETNDRQLTIQDERFNEFIKHVHQTEGGFIDNPKDRGGRTNKGITQKTFDAYNKKYGLPLKDVKDITKTEANEIYKKEYWEASGANNIKDRDLSLMHFDAAINHGIGNARKFLKESEGDFDKYYEIRKKFYADIIKNDNEQAEFEKGWNNRLNKIKKMKYN